MQILGAVQSGVEERRPFECANGSRTRPGWHPASLFGMRNVLSMRTLRTFCPLIVLHGTLKVFQSIWCGEMERFQSSWGIRSKVNAIPVGSRTRLRLLSWHHSPSAAVLSATHGSRGGTGATRPGLSLSEREVDLEELARRGSLVSTTIRLPTPDP